MWILNEEMAYENRSSIGCGICVDACSVGAIVVEEKAAIDDELCTGCAACIAECPNQAIIMAQKEFKK